MKKKIIDTHIQLRAFELEDLHSINKWHNDPEINDMTGGCQRFVSSEYDREWILDKINNNQNQVYCAIDCGDGSAKDFIGYLSLNKIDLVNRNAFWGGIIIGKSGYRNCGYAIQAAILMLQYGFYELGLIKITGHWMAENSVSVMMGRMLGFKQEGILRKEVYKNGEFHNVIVMSILEEEFQESLERINVI